MNKKTASNVPGNGTSGPNTKSHSTNTSSKGTSGKTNNNLPGACVLNSKHLHNQAHPQKPSNSREGDSSSSQESVLMKKLFEAVQKQQKSPEHEREPSQRATPTTDNRSSPNHKKPTNAHNTNTHSNNQHPHGNYHQQHQQMKQQKPPVKKTTINSSETYAGAAFDRAPAAASFPIPSFAGVSSRSSFSSVVVPLSTSCPEKVHGSSPPSASTLKALSVSELFKVEVSNEKQNLDAMTNDLRKMLNLR